MNQLIILVVALVVFVYFGGKYVPKVLKDNKQIMLGLVGGVVLCSFMCKSVEGFTTEEDPTGSFEEQCEQIHEQGPSTLMLCDTHDKGSPIQPGLRLVNGQYKLYSQAQIDYLETGRRATSEVREANISGCNFCPTCVNALDTQEGLGKCQQYIDTGTLACTDFAVGGRYAGYCDCITC